MSGQGHPRGSGDKLPNANEWLFGGDDWLVSGDDWLLSGDDSPGDQTLRDGNGGLPNGHTGLRNGNGRSRGAGVPLSGDHRPADGGETGPRGDDTRLLGSGSLPRGADRPGSRSARAPHGDARPRGRDAKRRADNKPRSGGKRPRSVDAGARSGDARPRSGAGAGRGRRSRRSIRAFLLTTVVSAIFVAGGAEYMIGQFSPQPSPLAEALTAIPSSKAGMKLMHQRQHMILMAAATKSFKVVGKPKVATKPAPPSGGGGGGGGAPIVNAPIPSPGTAQRIAYAMLPSFGFNAKQQYGCLNNIWTRESGWRVTAANASGAYGIPQALPGSKMASAGPNWQTNATTQIKWGLGYIKDRYGSPCSAWAFWEGHGWY